MTDQIRPSTRPAGQPRCPYCHEDLGPDPATRCSDCAAVFHPDCAREMSACSSIGCRGILQSPERVAEDREPGAWRFRAEALPGLAVENEGSESVLRLQEASKSAPMNGQAGCLLAVLVITGLLIIVEKMFAVVFLIAVGKGLADLLSDRPLAPAFRPDTGPMLVKEIRASGDTWQVFGVDGGAPLVFERGGVFRWLGGAEVELGGLALLIGARACPSDALMLELRRAWLA